MKIHLVTANEDSAVEQQFLVKAHTRAGAERFVAAKFKPTVKARVPSQADLVDALQSGIQIEDATGAQPDTNNAPQAQGE